MRAGPAFLQFDWSKAGLSMDLPVYVYSHTKTSFRFLSRQRKYKEAFLCGYRALVLSRLRLSRSTDHQDPVSENQRFFALQILQRYLTKEGRVRKFVHCLYG